MSSATTRNSGVTITPKPVFNADRREVLEAVSQGLHQVAQPMTVLQGVLELALITPGTEEQYKRALKRAMGQWQRVAASIEAIRQLLHARPCAISGGDFPTAASTEETQTITETSRRSTRV